MKSLFAKSHLLCKRIFLCCAKLKSFLQLRVARSGGWWPFLKLEIRFIQRNGLQGFKKRFLLLAQMFFGVEGSSQTPFQTIAEYGHWIKLYDEMTASQKQLMLKQVKESGNCPKISILIHFNNSQLGWLINTIRSVLKQTYFNFEVCIASDLPEAVIRSCFKSNKIQSHQIKIKYCEPFLEVSKALNIAADLAQGDFFATLKPGDLLSEQAMFLICSLVRKKPSVNIIYCDEDKIDTEGMRYEPHFKPDWNYDLFLSQNFIGEFVIYNQSIFRKLGGFQNLSGYHQYDLTMKCIEIISPDEIAHISKILYHSLSNIQDENYSRRKIKHKSKFVEGILNDHFKRKKISAKPKLMAIGMYRIHYSLHKKNPTVNLIIPTKNGFNLLKRCIESIFRKTRYNEYTITIVDNGSDEQRTLDYLAFLKKHEKAKVIRDARPFNFSALCNMAVAQSQCEFVALVNNDIEVISSDWLTEMVSLALQPKVGVVGAKLWYPDETLQHGGCILGIGGVAGHAHRFLKKGKIGYMGRAAVT